MEHKAIIEGALGLLQPRGSQYGTVHGNHKLIAALASALIGQKLTPRDIALVMVAVKLSRMRVSPDNVDHYMDAINYLAFAGEFSTEKKDD